MRKEISIFRIIIYGFDTIMIRLDLKTAYNQVSFIWIVLLLLNLFVNVQL